MLLTEQSLNIQAQQVTERLLLVANELGVEPHIFVLACADAVGTTAALLDRREGTSTLKDKMHSFNQRVELTYNRRRHAFEVQKN